MIATEKLAIWPAVTDWLTGCVVIVGFIEELLKVMLQKVVVPVVVIAAT